MFYNFAEIFIALATLANVGANALAILAAFITFRFTFLINHAITFAAIRYYAYLIGHLKKENI